MHGVYRKGQVRLLAPLTSSYESMLALCISNSIHFSYDQQTLIALRIAHRHGRPRMRLCLPVVLLTRIHSNSPSRHARNALSANFFDLVSLLSLLEVLAWISSAYLIVGVECTLGYRWKPLPSPPSSVELAWISCLVLGTMRERKLWESAPTFRWCMTGSYNLLPRLCWSRRS